LTYGKLVIFTIPASDTGFQNTDLLPASVELAVNIGKAGEMPAI